VIDPEILVVTLGEDRLMGGLVFETTMDSRPAGYGSAGGSR